jgi:hypothetical protein
LIGFFVTEIAIHLANSVIFALNAAPSIGRHKINQDFVAATCRGPGDFWHVFCSDKAVRLNLSTYVLPEAAGGKN